MNNIHDLLNKFENLWKESLNGNYSHCSEINSIAIKIRSAKCSDEFYLNSLTKTEQIYYNYALIIANL